MRPCSLLPSHFCHKWLLRVILAMAAPLAHWKQQTASLVVHWPSDSTEIHWGFREHWKIHLSISAHLGSGAQGKSGWSEQGTTGRSGPHLMLFGCCGLHGVHTSPILDSVAPAHPILGTLVQWSRCSFKQVTCMLRFVCFVDNCYTVIELCVYSAACFVWITQSFPCNITTP